MPLLIKADRVKETTTTTGTGSFTLDGAVAGYKAFSSVMGSDGNECFYTCINPATNEWECGLGSFTHPNILERIRSYSRSSGGTAGTFASTTFHSFGSGVKEVFISWTAAQSISGQVFGGNNLSPNYYLGTGAILDQADFATALNIMIGYGVMDYAASTASVSSNVAIGTNALRNIGSHSTPSSSGSNVAIGVRSGYGIFGGSSNIFIGKDVAGSPGGGGGATVDQKLDDCIIIGTSAFQLGYLTVGSSETNSIVIGAYAIGNGSNTTTIGHTTITDCYIRGHLYPSGAVRPASIADSSAPTNAIYYSTTASKLVYKDSSGTVNNLY